MTHNAHNDYLTRKLAHYNEWLLDNKREVGVPYGGFPEDQKAAKWATAPAPKAEQPTAPKPVAVKKAKKAKRVSGAGPTKQELATAIYKQCNGDKAATIAQIQSQLNMTLAGATTYYYNARKG
jgi:hypothetical protein